MKLDPVERDYNDPKIREQLRRKFCNKQTRTVSVANIEVMEKIINTKYDIRCVLDGQRTSYYLDSIAKQYIDAVYGNIEQYYEQRGITCEHLKIKEIRL